MHHWSVLRRKHRSFFSVFYILYELKFQFSSDEHEDILIPSGPGFQWLMLVLGIHKTLSVQKHYIDIVQLSLLYKIELYLYVHHPMRMANYRFVYGRSLYVHSQGFFQNI